MLMAIRWMLLGLLLSLSYTSWAAAPAQEDRANGQQHIAVRLLSEVTVPAAGSQITLALTMTPDKGWHGYWQRPGDAGFELQANWDLPAGVTVSDPRYPVPQTLIINGLMNHVYENPYALLVTVDIPDGLATGTSLPLSAQLSYLACTNSICVPEKAQVSTELVIGDGHIDKAKREQFDHWRQALPRPIGAAVTFAITDGRFRLAIPLPAAVDLPDPHIFALTGDVLVDAAEQHFTRQGDNLIVETSADKIQPEQFDGVLALGDGSGLLLQAEPGEVPAVGWQNSTLLVAILALAGAIVGGLILNIMPCVFPILSLKALSLAKLGGDERHARHEALAYTAGVMLVCLLLGGLVIALRAAGSEIGWAFQLQNPGVIFVLMLLTSAIGFNLAGLFELGAVVAGGELTAKSGSQGAFWTGVLAAFVATPCTGPFMAGALGSALILPLPAALMVFAGLGLGLALPFLLLGYWPAARRCLPKPGRWMETLRKFLAVPMFVTTLGLAWVLGRQTSVNGIVWGLAAILLISLGLWGTGLRQRQHKKLPWLPACIAFLLALASMVVLPQLVVAHNSTVSTASDNALAFNEEKLAELTAAGETVFLYFTADWCLTCKVNERTAIERDKTQQAFRQAHVKTMVGDWTNGDPAISHFIADHGRSGVPFYLWYSADGNVQELPQILSADMLMSLATINHN